MKEIFLDENENLIAEEKWKSFIVSIQSDFNNLETDKEKAISILKEKIVNAVKKRTQNLEHFGILFSGGVDSSLIALICKKLNLDFTCYSIGLENSKDVEAAKKVADFYNFDLKYKIFTLEEFEKIIKNTIKILKNSEIVWVSVGSVLYAAGNLALKDNVKVLFSGLGSEEIFAGYQRHGKAFERNFKEVHKECGRGLKNMWKRDLKRDFLISKNLDLGLRTPFLDLELIKSAMQIHPIFKINKTDKKIILREVAKDLGLKEEFAFRPKKAAQYGSNFVKGIDKLARKNGFKLKKDYLQSLV